MADRDSLNPSPTPGRPQRAPARSAARQTVELLLCLGIAVTLFRSFEVEGYMISTGSMAPSLLGYHKRVVCPRCGFPYSYGVAFDDSTTDEALEEGEVRAEAEHEKLPLLTRCPNCDQTGIDISEVPRNQGDQLLVHKHAFQIHPPRRWEVVVFKNPQRATQVYVKRVAGLPGERIQIQHGDVYINGEISRKTLVQQRGIRIPVYDHDYEPVDDPQWESRWVSFAEGGWEAVGRGFQYRAAEHASTDAHATHGDMLGWDWLAYQHWIRSGGRHQISVPLAEVPKGLERLLPNLVVGSPLDLAHRRCPVHINRRTGQLVCTGVMSTAWRDRLLDLSDHPDFQQAITTLHHDSHIGRITDYCSYNELNLRHSPAAVRDILLSLALRLAGETGQFLVQMRDGQHQCDCVFDLTQRTVELYFDAQSTPVRTAELPEYLINQTVQLEVSLFDRQVLVAVDDQLVFDPWPLEPVSDSTPVPRHAVRMGARGIDVDIDSLQLYRDVYYTRGRARNGVDSPYQLAEDEYFMLGDNSPVSSDSRNWANGAVRRHLLVGKPFLVHLPSRPGEIRVGDRSTYFRIPDFSRIRYIR